MKIKLMVTLMTLSFLINLISLYNIGLAYLSFFFFIQFFLPRIIMKIISIAEKYEEKESKPFTRFIIALVYHPIICLINRISFIISTIMLVVASLFMVVLQFVFKNEIHHFLHHMVQIGNIEVFLQICLYAGYAIFTIAILCVVIDSVKLLKKEKIFQVKDLI